jgi:AcrR family transcriptional regulator
LRSTSEESIRTRPGRARSARLEARPGRTRGTTSEETRPGRPRSESARRAILQASLDLLRTHGIGGVTAEAIAERAKVSKATLYRWWPCAAATAMDAFFDEVFSRLRSTATDDPLHDIRTRLRQGSRLMAGELGDVLAGLIATTHTDPRLAESFRERYVEPGRDNFRRLLQRAVDAGQLRADLDLEIALDVLSGVFFYRRLVRHEATSPRAMDAVLSFALEGLAPRAIAQGSGAAAARSSRQAARRASGTRRSTKPAAARAPVAAR